MGKLISIATVFWLINAAKSVTITSLNLPGGASMLSVSKPFDERANNAVFKFARKSSVTASKELKSRVSELNGKDEEVLV